MRPRIIIAIAFAASFSSIGAGQAADQCRVSKLWRSCASNANYSMCNGDLMCQMQADQAADFTCYTFKVPCAFNPTDLGDVMFPGFRYPVARTEYNVPRELAQ